MALDPVQEAELAQIIDRLFTIMVSVVTAKTEAGREVFRAQHATQMQDFRSLIVRNLIAGVQGTDQE